MVLDDLGWFVGDLCCFLGIQDVFWGHRMVLDGLGWFLGMQDAFG